MNTLWLSETSSLVCVAASRQPQTRNSNRDQRLNIESFSFLSNPNLCQMWYEMAPLNKKGRCDFVKNLLDVILTQPHRFVAAFKLGLERKPASVELLPEDLQIRLKIGD